MLLLVLLFSMVLLCYCSVVVTVAVIAVVVAVNACGGGSEAGEGALGRVKSIDSVEGDARAASGAPSSVGYWLLMPLLGAGKETMYPEAEAAEVVLAAICQFCAEHPDSVFQVCVVAADKVRHPRARVLMFVCSLPFAATTTDIVAGHTCTQPACVGRYLRCAGGA